jgi:Uma2 family endonuclease
MVDVASTDPRSSPARLKSRRAPRDDMPRMARPQPGRAQRTATSRRDPAPERKATVEDWLRIPEEKRAELIGGRIVYHLFPGVKHGDTQAQISHFLRPYRQRRTGGGGGGGESPGELGGWWLSQEVDMVIGDVGCRPDVVGWRRDRHARVPQPDARGVVTERPDFLCEVLSASTARYDQGEKRDAYFHAAVPYYWLVDPEIRTLTVLEWTPRGYLILRVAGPGETVRAAPFEGVEIPVDELFMDEEGELAAEGTAVSPAETAVKAPGKAPARRGQKAPAKGAKRGASKGPGPAGAPRRTAG